MTLTEEQRAALKRVVAYMDDMYAIASPYHGCTEDANILRAMIDSSGTVDYDGLRCESCGKTLTEIRGSKYAGDYCMGEIRLDPGQEASRSDPPIEPSYYFWCDECKNDSSDQFNEPDELIGFDLERARGLRDFLQDDCAEVGDVWAEMIAEIERLRPFEIAARDLDSDLTKIAGERDDQATRIKELEADLEQAERVIEARLEVIDQQAARIKSLKKEIRRLKHESKVEQELTNSYIKHLHEAEARIKELEEAHKRSGAKYAKIIRELRSSVYANIPGLKKQWDEVLADGKISIGDHIVGPDQMVPCWQITEERKAAIWHAVAVLKENDPDDEHLWDEEIAVLRAMLREAE